ncbi:MAG TPA: flavodoxin family protein [Methanocella sp.]|nr:flavodoxin family protein [Methanocella sp.]
MSRTVTIIIGSPSKGSNTHILAGEAQKGLEAIGVGSRVFFLNDMDIKGCQSCLSCKVKNTVECAVKDDMQLIYQAMEASDGILVATPIYFGYVTAQAKMWLDRMFPYLGSKEVVKEGVRTDLTGLMPGRKRAGFIFTQNQPDPGLFIDDIRKFMDKVSLVGFEAGGYLLATDLARGMKPMVTENEACMRAAYDLGKKYFE